MSTPLGGWIVTAFPRLSSRWLSIILGMAAGIMLTVVITELMPSSVRTAGPRIFLVGVAIGWAFMVLTSYVVRRVSGDHDDGSAISHFRNMGWFITIAMALHDLPEGIAIGAGDAVHRELGAIIALAIAIHNIPEGMGIAAPLRLAGVSKSHILAITFFTGLVTPVGTFISLAFVHVSNQFLSLSLAFAAGAMLYVVAKNILPASLTENWGLTALGGGFGTGIMLLVSQIAGH